MKAFQPDDSPPNSLRRTYDGGGGKAHEQHRAKSARAASAFDVHAPFS